MRKKQYWEAMSMADYALEGEGHTQLETADEFKVSASTVRNRINGLAEKQPEVYQKVMKKWHRKDQSFESKIV